MKKNLNDSKNSSVQSQLSQQEATPLSTLTMDELESVCVGGQLGLTPTGWSYRSNYKCSLCNDENFDA